MEVRETVHHGKLAAVTSARIWTNVYFELSRIQHYLQNRVPANNEYI